MNGSNALEFGRRLFIGAMTFNALLGVMLVIDFLRRYIRRYWK